MLSRNEWDKLEHVIVGRADGARIPVMDRSLRTINYSHMLDVHQVPTGPYPHTVISEANQDLDTLAQALISMDIKVSRPSLDQAPGYYHYCPRDSVLVLERMVIETPMPLRARANESDALAPIFHELDDDFDWIHLRARRSDALYDLDAVGDRDRLALTDHEASFDAANIIRANDDVFYLVSNSGNRRGAELLQRIVPSNVRVWPIHDIYSYMHIDSTVTLLREGLMLLNPERIRDVSQLPEPLHNWDVIWAPEPGEGWHYPGYCNSSRWSSMNLLSISPDLVVIEEQHTSLASELDRHGIDSLRLPMRHSRTLGGSFHCVTLDIKRDCQ